AEARVRLDKSRKTGSGEEVKNGKIEQAVQAQELAEQLKGVIKEAGYLTVLTEVGGHISNFSDKLNKYTGLLE
ncbi:methyl-accepting chemotaxis protein, partial [Pseudomonas graminis]